jgi:hypothetical protein
VGGATDASRLPFSQWRDRSVVSDAALQVRNDPIKIGAIV